VFSKEAFIGIMITYPKPYNRVFLHNAQSSISQSNSDGPDIFSLMDAFKMK